MTTRASPGTRYCLRVTSVHTDDSGPSLLVVFDNARYLFNAPESFTRAAVQSRVALGKVRHVFLGGLGPTAAGLPGLLLSSAEGGNKLMQITGPEGLDHMLATCRTFTRREQLAVSLNVVSSLDAASQASTSSLPLPAYADENLIVYPFTSTASSSTGPSLKRRRSSSPSFREATPVAAATGASTGDLEAEMSVQDSPRLLDPSALGFDPSVLAGEHAAEWRSLVVADMFRGAQSQPPKVVSSPLLPSAANPATVRTLAPASATNNNNNGGYRRSRAQTPSYLPAALPRLYPVPAPTAISYLAVGPSLRGEFLGAEASKRGVRAGPKFAALVRGERVWVPVRPEVVTEEGAAPSVPTTEAPTVKRVKGQTKAKGDQARGDKSMSKAAYRADMAARAKFDAAVIDGEGSGHWVNSEDCVGPGEAASAFLVINIPSLDFLDSTTRMLQPSSLTSIENATLKTVFYFLGPGVLADPRLAVWMNSLPLGLEHRVSSSDLTPSANPVLFAPAALLSLRLSELSPTIFRLPQYTYLPASTLADAELLPPSMPPSTTILRQQDRVYQGSRKNLAAVHSAVETRSFDFDVPSSLAAAEAGRLKGDEKGEATQLAAKRYWDEYLVEAATAKAEVEVEALERARQIVSGERTVEVGDDLRVTPLGTGSAVPSKYRNVSSTLLHLPNAGGYILLDAGEGTWGQLARRFGKVGDETAKHVLQGLKCIFISHMHQDHHMGLATVLYQRSQLSPPPVDPLVIIAPPGIRQYLAEQQQLFDVGVGRTDWGGANGIKFVDSYPIEVGKTLPPRHIAHESLANLHTLLGLKSITTVPVLHRCRCWGITIEHESGWKVVFSGDTMPCEALVRAGSDATLLIHEATIEDDLPEVASAKGHSTFEQAISVARRMKAKHCLLTHFSARYPKLPPLSDPLAEIDGVREPIVAMAFDMATLRLDEFWKMERYRPAMGVLFQDDEGDDASVVV